MARQWLGKSYTVTYNSSNPLSILTQKLGSVWPTILPYCILNTLLMAILHVLLAHGIDLDISEQGHTFMSLVVSFLLVSRVSMAVGRYYEARDFLETMNKSFLQLVFTVCIYSNRDGSLSAKEWRNEVAYAALILVRTAMAVLDFPSSGVKVMNIPEVNGAILQDLESSLPPTRWLHEARTEYEENFRIPIRLSYLLRESIRSQEGRVEPAIPAVAEGDLYAFVNGGMDGYFGLHKFVTTPVPFPLLQMSSTFLWFYIFTVPFALLSADDVGIKSALSHCLMIFIMTFGFIGMEHVAVQMDDPFGGDENDFK
jgi:predicted membrane chloride channel (bestrophin family)